MTSNAKLVRVSGRFVVRLPEDRPGDSRTMRVEDCFEPGWPVASMLAVLELEIDRRFRGREATILDRHLDVIG